MGDVDVFSLCISVMFFLERGVFGCFGGWGYMVALRWAGLGLLLVI